jgi:hypothetical protein
MNNLESAPCGRGKIARLPASLRHQVNLRLENNQPAPTLLAWLNALPETKLVLNSQFGGAPVSPQNLSEWRQSGLRQWLLLQELRDHAAQFQEGAAALQAQCEPQTLADNLAAVLAARYAALLQTWDGEITPAFEAKIRLLRGLTHDITQLQKSLHRAAQQRRDLARQKKEDAAQDLAQAKQDTISRLKTNIRAANLSVINPPDIARAIAAVEIAQTENEVFQVLPHRKSNLIQPNPANFTPSTLNQPPENPQTEPRQEAIS